MPYYVAEFLDENNQRHKKNLWATNHIRAQGNFEEEHPFARIISIQMTYYDVPNNGNEL
jgi:hypothetical protein